MQKIVDFDSLGLQRPNFLPILVTGSREPLAVGLLRSINVTLSSMPTQDDDNVKDILSQIQKHLQVTSEIDQMISEDVFENLLDDVMTWVIQAQIGTGLLIIIDELGKFLEFATYSSSSAGYVLATKTCRNSFEEWKKTFISYWYFTSRI